MDTLKLRELLGTAATLIVRIEQTPDEGTLVAAEGALVQLLRQSYEVASGSTADTTDDPSLPGPVNAARKKRMPFGKHKGKSFGEIIDGGELGYVSWMYREQVPNSPDLCEAVTVLYRHYVVPDVEALEPNDDYKSPREGASAPSPPGQEGASAPSPPEADEQPVVEERPEAAVGAPSPPLGSPEPSPYADDGDLSGEIPPYDLGPDEDPDNIPF